jgi:hypothetical protein
MKFFNIIFLFVGVAYLSHNALAKRVEFKSIELGKAYLYDKKIYNFATAVEECKLNSSRILTPQSQHEVNVLFDHFKPIWFVWIGGYSRANSSQFFWQNGTVITTNNFANGHPKPSNGLERGIYVSNVDRKWYDKRAAFNYNLMCERLLSEEEIRDLAEPEATKQSQAFRGITEEEARSTSSPSEEPEELVIEIDREVVSESVPIRVQQVEEVTEKLIQTIVESKSTSQSEYIGRKFDNTMQEMLGQDFDITPKTTEGVAPAVTAPFQTEAPEQVCPQPVTIERVSPSNSGKNVHGVDEREPKPVEPTRNERLKAMLRERDQIVADILNEDRSMRESIADISKSQANIADSFAQQGKTMRAVSKASRTVYDVNMKDANEIAIAQANMEGTLNQVNLTLQGYDYNWFNRTRPLI